MNIIVGTVLSGVLIFVCGQILLKFVVEPLQAFHQLKGNIAHSLIFYESIYFHPGQCPQAEMQEAKEALRRQASELLGTAHMIPWYSLCAFLRLVPSWKELRTAHDYLNGLSGGVFGGGGASSNDNDRRRKTIIKALRLRVE